MTFWEALLQLLGALVALAAVLLLAWFILRAIGRGMPGTASGPVRLVKVLDRVAVNRNSTILLLRVQDKVILVAMTDHGTEKLCEWDDPEGLITNAQGAENTLSGFSAVLRDAAKKLVKKPPPDGAGAPDGTNSGAEAADAPDAPGGQETPGGQNWDGGETP